MALSGRPAQAGSDLHTILLDPKNPNRMFIAISAAGAFRTDDGGKTWKPINRGLKSEYIPDPDAPVGPLRPPHRHAQVAAETVFMQKHWDVMRTDDAGENWTEVSGNLPRISGSRSTCTRTSPRRSTSSRSRATANTIRPEGKLRVYRSKTGGNEWEALTKGLPQRIAMSTSSRSDGGRPAR